MELLLAAKAVCRRMGVARLIAGEARVSLSNFGVLQVDGVELLFDFDDTKTLVLLILIKLLSVSEMNPTPRQSFT